MPQPVPFHAFVNPASRETILNFAPAFIMARWMAIKPVSSKPLATIMAIVFPEKLDRFIRILLKIELGSLALTFARKVTLASTNRSAGRACRVKIRIAPAYTWLCQFVQALLAIGLIKTVHKAQIIRKVFSSFGYLRICSTIQKA